MGGAISLRAVRGTVCFHRQTSYDSMPAPLKAQALIHPNPSRTAYGDRRGASRSAPTSLQFWMFNAASLWHGHLAREGAMAGRPSANACGGQSCPHPIMAKMAMPRRYNCLFLGRQRASLISGKSGVIGEMTQCRRAGAGGSFGERVGYFSRCCRKVWWLARSKALISAFGPKFNPLKNKDLASPGCRKK